MNIKILNNIEIEYLIDLIESDRERSKGFSKYKTGIVEKLVKKLTIPDVVSMSKCCNADCQEPISSPDGVYCEFHRSM